MAKKMLIVLFAYFCEYIKIPLHLQFRSFFNVHETFMSHLGCQINFSRMLNPGPVSLGVEPIRLFKKEIFYGIILVDIYFLKSRNGNIRTMHKTCSKLTIKTRERHQ